MRDPLIGLRFAERYEVASRLGEGGWGVVYKAFDRVERREVALKVIRPELADRTGTRRFLREVQATTLIRHPNTVRVLESGQADDGSLFLVMELLKGEQLSSLLMNGSLSPERLVPIALQILRALQAAHEAGVIHRDLKPENVIIGPGDRVKVLDFGIARFMPGRTLGEKHQTKLTAEGVVVGTPNYIAPEQVSQRPLDQRCDLYSFGVLLFEMTTGRLPFTNDDNPLLVAYAHVREQPPRPSDVADQPVPPWLEALILRLLEKRPKNRPQSAEEVIRVLGQATQPIRAEGMGLALPAFAGLSLGLMGAGALAVAIAVGMWLWVGSQSSLPDEPLLAVGPFEGSLPQDLGPAWLEGVEDEVHRVLASSPDRRVLRRTSANETVSGSLARTAEDFQLEIVVGRDGQRLWSQSYTGPDLLAILRTATPAAMEALGIGPGPLARGTADFEAWTAFQGARRELRLGTPEAGERARRGFELALEADPRFALAAAELGAAWMAAIHRGWEPAESWAYAREAAERAVELDPDAPRAHEVLGLVALHDGWRWSQALRELETAVALAPRDPSPRLQQARWTVCRGEDRTATSQLRHGSALAPGSEASRLAEAWVAYHQGESQAAVDAVEGLVGLEAYWLAGRALAALGDHGAALNAFEIASRESTAPFLLAEVGRVLALQGRADDAEKALEALEFRAASEPVPPTSFAVLYAGLQRSEEAISWLEAAERAGDPAAICVAVDPVFRALRDEPSFRRVVERIGTADAL